MESTRLYFKYIAMAIKGQMAYKSSFIMMSIGHFAITAIEFLGVYILFDRFEQLKGWTLYEVAVFYGVISMAFAFTEAFGRGYDRFHEYIRMGDFDRYLLRPRSLNLQILGSDFQLMRIGRFLQGLMVLGYGMHHLEFEQPMLVILTLILALVGAVLTFLGLFTLQAAMSIFTIQTLEIANAFTYGGVQMAQYPMDIYKSWFRKIFLFLIPLGTVTYFPIMSVLGRGSLVIGLATPLVGLVFYAFSIWIFNYGVRYYCSTGS